MMEHLFSGRRSGKVAAIVRQVSDAGGLLLCPTREDAESVREAYGGVVVEVSAQPPLPWLEPVITHAWKAGHKMGTAKTSTTKKPSEEGSE